MVRVHLSPLLNKLIYLYGGVAQLGEHLPCKQGVKSSNLSVSIESEMILVRKHIKLNKYEESKILPKRIDRFALYLENYTLENIKTSEDASKDAT